MLPEGLYKRRKSHNNTPPTVLLVLTNCIVLALLIQAFTGCTSINNFFWVAIAALALYNVYTIRRNPDEYNMKNVIVYFGSIGFMVFLFFYFSNQPHNC
jgi:amino acid transporter